MAKFNHKFNMADDKVTVNALPEIDKISLGFTNTFSDADINFIIDYQMARDIIAKLGAVLPEFIKNEKVGE